jgi:hypothetical protein
MPSERAVIVPHIVYGEGGYNPTLPNDNVIAVEEIDVPDPAPSVDDLRDKLAGATTNAKLRDVLGQILDVLDG